ncbi:MAG: carbohydrate-binding protein [Chitinophagales bacterium]
MTKAEIQGGIIVTPVPITAGDSVHLIYNGLLSESGASKVYLHAGFGTSEHWTMIRDQEMTRSKWGWETVMDMQGDQRFNFCFRDCASNWDNNNGHNWSYEIHNGSMPR